MKFVGGGGTNFDAAVGAFSRRVKIKLYLLLDKLYFYEIKAKQKENQDN